MADAGRVIAGTARGRRLVAPGEGTRPLADRVKQTLFAILEPDLAGAPRSSTCAPGAARPGSRPCRAARRGRRSWSATGGAADDDRREPRADRPGRTERPDRPGRRGRLAREPSPAAGATPPTGRSTSSSSTRPTPSATSSPGSSAILGSDAAGRLLAPGARVVAKHFWRDRPPTTVGLLASERDRRFGETGLTFYRREGR